MFDKFLSKVGIGAAKVDTVLNHTEVVRGGFLEGQIRMHGGKVDQEINKIYLELISYYFYETDHGESTASFVLHRLDIDEDFILRAGEEVAYDFELEVPLVTPVTFGETRVNLKTGLDVSKAFDPKDNDPVDILAEPATERLMMAAEALGFVHEPESGTCYQVPSAYEVPFVQAFLLRAEGPIAAHVESMEIIVAANETETEVIINLDKRNHGLMGHIRDGLALDKSEIRFSLGQDMDFGPENLDGIIMEALQV